MNIETMVKKPWRTGARDWIWQRVSAVIICLYAIPLLSYWLLNPDAGYKNWYAYLMHPLNRVLGLLCVLAVIVHAAIGLWVVVTDYVKPKMLRKVVVICMHTLLLLEAIWAVVILWGF